MGDNTRVNLRGLSLLETLLESMLEKTADDQSFNEYDVETTPKIRIQIIKILDKAGKIAGSINVQDEMDIIQNGHHSEWSLMF